jgi:hypothetical protein
MMADESNINKKTIHQTLREDLRRVRHTQIHGRAEAMENHIMPRLHPDLSRQSQFSCLHFLFPKVKTALKGKRFQDVLRH